MMKGINILKSVLLLLVCCFMCFEGVLSRANAVNLGIQGIVSATLYAINGRAVTNFAHPFTVVVGSGGCWNVKADYGENYYRCTGSDGTKVCSILQVPQINSGKSVPAYIAPAGYPSEDDWPITLPWLCWCSKDYLDAHGNNELPAPWLNAHTEPVVLIVGSEITRESAGGLPSQIKFHTEKALAKNSARVNWLNAGYKGEDNMIKAEVYPDGFEIADYVVSASTNYNGENVPLEFKLDVYKLKPNRFLYSSFVGTVSRFFTPSNASFLPELKTKANVADFRYRDTDSEVDYITYQLADCNWTSPEPAVLKSSFQAKQSQAKTMERYRPMVEKHQTKVRWIIISILVAITLIPISFYLVKRHHNEN